MKVAIGNDHAGLECKLLIVKFLNKKKFEIDDYGTDSLDDVDYPDVAHKVSKEINKKNVDFGILICGTGNGMAMTANKHQNVRAGICWNREIASLIRKHNDANLLCIPSRFLDISEIMEIVESFFVSNFERGRHKNRVEKIKNV